MPPGLCTLTMTSWRGELPVPGHYVKAPRGRTAFLIVEVRQPIRAGARYAARFICERANPARLPADAVVHPFYWNPR